MNQSISQNDTVESQVRQWLEQVVIGLNLCPFAATPHQAQQIRFVTSNCQEAECLLTELATELALLTQTEPNDIETTLLILPHMLDSFNDYNQFLNHVDALLEQLNFGSFEFQVGKPII